jgi:hypothetical protein
VEAQMKRCKWLFFVFMFAALVINGTVAFAKSTFEVTGQCEVSPKATVRIKVDASSYDGFDIYRADTAGQYQYVGYVGIAKEDSTQNSDEDDDYWYDGEYESGYDYSKNNYSSTYQLEKKKYVEYRSYTFTDETELVVGQTYQYRVEGYHFVNGEKQIVATKDVSVVILSAGPQFTYGKRSGKLGAKLKWNKVDNAEGYMIYYVKNYDEKSNYLDVDTEDFSQYKLLKTIKGGNNLSATFSKLMNGVTYTYRICSYQTINGKKVASTFSEAKAVTMNYYSCDSESYSQRIKRAFGSEKKKKSNFKTASKASKQMKTIKIKVWDYKKGKKGKKVTKTKYLTVNKKLAPSIQQMFKEIYKSKEKQVIKDIGCYSYRTGEHMYGMAIDINPNENYMIDKVNGKKKILSGSYWKPKKDPYSIPADCELVRIMQRYGFYRGDWGDRKDYMHFSYFGT